MTGISPSAAPIPTCDAARPEPYQPGSGFEGAAFMAAFCDRCKRDAAFQNGTGDSCPIAAATMVFDVEDDRYPAEWVHGADGEPTCTAFEPKSKPLCPVCLDPFCDEAEKWADAHKATTANAVGTKPKAE